MITLHILLSLNLSNTVMLRKGRLNIKILRQNIWSRELNIINRHTLLRLVNTKEMLLLSPALQVRLLLSVMLLDLFRNFFVCKGKIRA
jgi:hypothetical protein